MHTRKIAQSSETVTRRSLLKAVGAGGVALALVAAVSDAGGLGVLGVAPEPPPVFAERIAQIRALTSRPAGESVHQIHDIKPAAQIVADMMAEAQSILAGRLAQPEA